MQLSSNVIPDSIKFVILVTLLLDWVPIIWNTAKTWIRPENLMLDHPALTDTEMTRLLSPGGHEDFEIEGYRNSSTLQRWGKATYGMSWRISIHVFAWRREKSLRRLCESLLRAQYSGHEVPLYFHVDGEPLNLVVNYVKDFKWPHGPKIVNIRQQKLGMPTAILSGWTPKDDEEHAILLEDDTEVAVGFFEYSLYCLSMTTYKRLVEGENHGMMGCSLYTPRVDEIGPAPNAWSPPTWNPTYAIGPRHRLLYFQLPCSWGAIYHAKYWKEFLRYYAIRTQISNFPLTPNSRSNEWFSSWKRILIELMLFRGWYLMYPSFLGQTSFSTNYFERGIHSVAEGQKAPVPNEIRKHGDRRFTVPLYQDFSFRASLPTPSAGSIRQIPYVSLYHKRVMSRRELVVNVQPFLDAVKDPALYHFFGQEVSVPDLSLGADLEMDHVSPIPDGGDFVPEVPEEQ
ncbi:hypothetical protein PSACC_03264 [Paramicrosporidium saccamoebae]|uniref:Uncharacterized protein n=1 Tax=Paramicrosporidium saccamoebae TaxID=1246581 RepID=A0A2H9TGS3_9FUNG|nr:hypothetical protein PSACC_03264 [Paramicrosporidium saccamoebae]